MYGDHQNNYVRTMKTCSKIIITDHENKCTEIINITIVEP